MPVRLVRHTAVAVEHGLCYGTSDVALADTFAADVARVRSRLPAGPLRIVSSPSTRCLRLARELAGPAAVPSIDPRLLELHFGAWEGRRWNDLPRGEVDAWADDFVRRAPPGGESFSALASRVEACLADWRQRAPDGELVLVTHAGPIRALLAPRSGLTLDRAFSLVVEFGGVYPLPPEP